MSDDLAVVTATVYFGLPAAGADFFTLEDPVKGQLDGSYGLAGDVGTDLGCDLLSLSITRGRERETDEFEPGDSTLILQNTSRDYDDEHTSSPYYGEVKPGKKVRFSVWGQVIFTGTVDDWNMRWSSDGFAEAELVAVDALGRLARRRFDAWTTTGGQTADERLNDMLDRSEIALDVERRFDAGINTLQADNVSWDALALPAMQIVVKSDQGRLSATRDGALRFQNRHALVNPTATVTFGEGGLDFDLIETQNGSELLFNRVGVDRLNGTLQTVEDVASQDAYDIRPDSITDILVESDSVSADMAAWRLGQYKEPKQRVSSISVLVNALDPADRATVARIDLGDVLGVVWTPLGIGNELDNLYAVEGVRHDIAEGLHWMRISTSPLSQTAVFVLEDPFYGQLDGVAGLAY